MKRRNRKRRNINCKTKGNWRKRKGSKENYYGKGSRATSCLIEGHPCLVAFVYESNNNVVSQRLMEKIQLPTSFHSNQAWHQSWWTFPLFEAWRTWNEVEIYDNKRSQEGWTYVEGQNRKKRIQKEEI